MEEFKIDLDVSLPEGRRHYPFKIMEVGDSFDCTGIKKITSGAAYAYGKLHNKKFSVRKTETRYRCWHIK